MVSGTKQLILAGAAVALSIADPLCDPSRAAGLLPNGDFEAGSLIGWTASARRDGITDVVTAGDCFFAGDTTRITLFGNHAAILRSGPSGRRGSVGMLTSDAFVAGDGVVFAALTGTRDGHRVDRPVHFEVRILSADGDALTAQRFNTSVVRLREGCPGEARDGRFYVHYFDTRKFLGQDIRIQFRQNTNSGGIQPFTLIDQVIHFGRGEGPLFSSKPEAVAALSETRRGVLRLDGSNSFDPDEGPLSLTYSWQIDGENQVRVGEYPCVGDLADGTYQATLFVNDGFHAVSDSLLFEVTGSTAAGGNTATDNGDGDDGDGNGDDGDGNGDNGDGNGDNGNGDNGNGDNGNGDDPVPTVEIGGCDEEVLATDVSVDSGSAGDGDDDNGNPGNGGDTGNGIGNGNGDGDDTGGDNEAPDLDLDADNSSVDGINYQTTFELGGTAVAISDADIQISDIDGDDIESAVVIFQDFEAGDELNVDEIMVPSGISVDADDNSVQFQGIGSANDYELAVRAVSFTSTATEPGTRIVTVSVKDDQAQSTIAITSIMILPSS